MITRTIPIHLSARERCRRGKGSMTKEENRKETIREWQELWTGYKGSTWTRSLIPNIDSWYYRRHGELSFHTSQMLTGHGCFQKYLYDIKKTESPLCLYCKKDEDTAEHTFMECTHWEKQREETNLKIGKDLKTNNIGTIMLESEEKWKAIAKYCREILQTKEEDERKRERNLCDR